MSFTFELAIGGDVVKRVTFANDRGRRVLQSSGGKTVGELVLTPKGLRLVLDERAANIIADSNFH